MYAISIWPFYKRKKRITKIFKTHNFLSRKQIPTISYLLVQILKFVQSFVLLHLQTIGQNVIWFATKQMFCFKPSNLRNSCENVRSMSLKINAPKTILLALKSNLYGEKKRKIG